ncbi:MAG: hypothetical protein ACLRFL_03430 [Clostridia bacterium]
MSNIENIKNLSEKVYIDFVNSIGRYIISEGGEVKLFAEDNDNHMLLVISSPKETYEKSLINSIFIFEDTKCVWKNEKFGQDLDLSTAWVQFRANKKLLCKLIAERWNDNIRKQMRTLQKSMISTDTMNTLKYTTSENEIE